MAEILFHSRLSASLFAGLAPWTTRLPGRLLHVNVLGCTMFAAISGSSAATTATVGRITLTELLRRGYDRDLAMGSLAGAGTLGFLIPPSIILIIYGVLFRDVDPQALHRRDHSGAPARLPLHDVARDPGHHESLRRARTSPRT